MTNFSNKKLSNKFLLINLKKTINKIQKNINNLHENITKLKNNTEITKSKMFSYENVSHNKEMFKSTTRLEADDFQAAFVYLSFLCT